MGSRDSNFEIGSAEALAEVSLLREVKALVVVSMEGVDKGVEHDHPRIREQFGYFIVVIDVFLMVSFSESQVSELFKKNVALIPHIGGESFLNKAVLLVLLVGCVCPNIKSRESEDVDILESISIVPISFSIYIDKC